MRQRIIPIHAEPQVLPQTPVSASSLPLSDRYQRPLRDLRISVTDRCNFRCPYCMPKAVFDHTYRYLPQQDILSFEEIVQVAQAAIGLGVEKLRLTGGEPLLRRKIETLVAQLAQLRTPDGKPIDLALTTNGSLLAKKAQTLKDAGLQRLTVSLDALDEAVFRRMNDREIGLATVFEGLEAARKAGFERIKINMVVQRDVNLDQLKPLLAFCAGEGYLLRIIEFMDVGNANQWALTQVVPSAEICRHLSDDYLLTPLAPNYEGEVAQRWHYQQRQAPYLSGELGLIASVTQAFCQHCSRARLATDGKLYTCLFATTGHDLRPILRATNQHDTTPGERLTNVLAAIWHARTDAYSAQRMAIRAQQATPHSTAHKIEMSYIGG
ncbi:GTP 3',8-cyclase MoaA [Parvibium lacunae]|uniref:GTP 3',8-cyclase n=1 Tax=Parvibium lacunae TaxID=1888893 RepID=A0A368L3V9_9BURK|nr:GTP 3',8-cyclase MoaA [Parvibium lacunae]RCS58249.1 GTP 3',8-cyclase MoaA [Parvibium lacunae]